MRDEFWLEDQSPDLFDIEDDQTPDSFGAFSGVLVGPPGPPGPQGPPGADGTVSFDELTPAQRESLRGEGVPAGGTTGQVLAKTSNTDYDTEWVDQSGGGGGTTDYDDLTNKPSINNVTLSGNKTAAQLGLAAASDIPTVPVQSVNGKTGVVVLSASDVGAGTYSKPSGGIPKSDLASAVQTSLGKADTALQSVPSTYRTAAAQDAIDAIEVIVVNISSYSGSQVRVPASGTNAAITASHVLLASTVGTPVYQTDDWTVTTYDGYLTLSGSASAATTVQLVLGKVGTTI